MEEVQASLESILRKSFHVIPTRTRRQEQIYKRRYTQWKKENPDRDLCILSTKESKDEWVVGISRIATELATILRDSTFRNNLLKTDQNVPSESKLFGDWVLEDNMSRLKPPEVDEQRSLTPAMQRLSFWSWQILPSAELRTYARAVRELILRRQIQSLIYLVHKPNTRIREVANTTMRAGNDHGWQIMVHDIAQLLMFLVILKCFSEALLLNQGYRYLVPLLFRNRDCLMWQYVLGPHGGDALAEGKHLQEDVNWCFEILGILDVLRTECGFQPVQWERCLVDAFLSLVGFEAWNLAGKGGPAYATKKQAWVLENLRKDGVLTASENSGLETHDKVKQSPKSKDPLLLREPGGIHHVESDGDDSDEDEDGQNKNERLKKLSDLQSQETAYGLKRSTKYQRRTEEETF